MINNIIIFLNILQYHSINFPHNTYYLLCYYYYLLLLHMILSLLLHMIFYTGFLTVTSVFSNFSAVDCHCCISVTIISELSDFVLYSIYFPKQFFPVRVNLVCFIQRRIGVSNTSALKHLTC